MYGIRKWGKSRLVPAGYDSGLLTTFLLHPLPFVPRYNFLLGTRVFPNAFRFLHYLSCCFFCSCSQKGRQRENIDPSFKVTQQAFIELDLTG